MTPDARVQEAVELMRRLGTDGEQPITNQLIEAGLAYHERTFVYGYLASTPETERLRSALKAARSALRQAEHRLDDFHGTEAIQSVCAAAARDIDSLLTPPRDPR